PLGGRWRAAQDVRLVHRRRDQRLLGHSAARVVTRSRAGLVRIVERDDVALIEAPGRRETGVWVIEVEVLGRQMLGGLVLRHLRERVARTALFFLFLLVESGECM